MNRLVSAPPARSIVGAPFDGGTSHRPGARFGPQAIRFTDYLAHDGMRPHLALGVDPLTELPVVDAGDVQMLPGEIEKSLGRLEQAVTAISRTGCLPVVLGGDHSITFPDATGVARHVGWGRLALVHFDAHADTANTQYRFALRARDADAPADRIRSGARGTVLPDRPARLLARPRGPGLDGHPGDAQLRDG